MEDMKHVLITSIVGLCLTASGALASISTTNIFNTGTSQGTVNASSAYNLGIFPYSGVDDLSGTNANNEFFFQDFGVDNTLSISSFSAPAGISTLRIYDAQEYEPTRVAQSVTVYTSTTNQTSVLTSSYTLLGTFALPIGSNGFYTSGMDSAPTSTNYGYYDDLSGLNIAAGTQSILFDFGHAGDIGTGVSEIQAFGAVPEPGTYGLMFVGGAMLLGVLRLNRALV